jgi:beta-glucosidase
MGTGFVLGAQQHVIASAKHFALNSIEDVRFNVNVTVDERTLREIYLPHFRMVVQDGHVGSVMSAYNQVNGAYAAENTPLLHDMLKNEWQFAGFVESDWFVGVRSTVGSLRAGLDIEMPQAAWYGNRLMAAVTNGEAPVRLINDAVRRILRTTLCFALDTHPPQVDPTHIETPEHTALAREAEEKAIVLLRNQDATLPLTAGELSSIAVVGPLADRANLGDIGSSNVSPSYTVTPLAGIREQAPEAAITHIADLPFSEDDSATIANADVAIVVVGLTAQDEGEDLIVFGGDRVGMSLPRNQDTLIASVAALNPHTIVVLEGGSAITMDPWIDRVSAVLMAWYPGLEGGHAIANVLFAAANPLTGRLSPSGKLPITFPRAESDLPPFINDLNEVTYDYYHGYRYVDRHEIEPLFPFGFGLSYTSFAYANLSLSSSEIAADGTVDLSFDVMNTGDFAGQEVAQLYVSYTGSRVDRPLRDLKGFARIAVAPGATQRVTLPLRAADLAFYDVATRTWVVEPITYTVAIGASSRDIRLEGTVTVAD